MRLTDDLTSRRAIFLKGWLFLVLGLLASGCLLLLHPGWDTAALLAVALWAFCRWYFFAFYVVERYVDPSFRFDGLGSFARYLWRSRRASFPTPNPSTPPDERRQRTKALPRGDEEGG